VASSKEPLPFFAPPPATEEEPEHVPPAWYGPPDDVIGQAAGEGFVLARTDALALAVWGITAFPTGLAFSLAIVVRRADDPDLDPELDLDMAMHRYWRGRRRGSEPGLPDDLLRFGVEFEDGRKATSLGWGSAGAEDETPPGPILMQRGGGGGGRSYRMGWWLWPLPLGEHLTFVCEWPAHGIALTRHEVDAATFREAAERARPIWVE
jgi:hypothetical protein